MKISPLTFAIFSFLVGVFISDIFREYWVLNFIFLFFIIPIFKKNFSSEFIFFIVIGIFGFVLGCIRLFFSIPSSKLILPNVVKNTPNNNISIRAIVSSFPKYTYDKIIFEADVLCIYKNDICNSSIFKQKEKVLVHLLPKNRDIEYGNIVEISGKLKMPKNKEDEKFSYKRFLEKSGIYTFFFYPEIKITEKNNKNMNFYDKWNTFWQKIFRLRKNFELEVRKKLPVVESEYALGILLGAEWGIPKNILQEFNITGLRHLLALSGFNITILIVILFNIFFFLPKKLQISMAIILISFFVLLTGSSSSVVRAAIMGSLGLIILHSGRGNSKNIPKLLLITIFGMTLWNPFVLLSDVSLQFSVLAVLGLFYFVPYLKKKFQRIGKTFLGEVLFATVSAQIFTLPLSIVLFENFSVVSPFANIIVSPITSFAMFFSFLTAIPYVGWLFVPISFVFLNFSLTVAHLFSILPFSHITITFLPLWSIIPLFIGLGIFIWKNKNI